MLYPSVLVCESFSASPASVRASQSVVTWLKRLNLEPFKLQQGPPQQALNAVITAIGAADGVIVLCFERWRIERGHVWAAEGCQPVADLSLASPWLHAELAIAHTLKKPILALMEHSVVGEGVFASLPPDAICKAPVAAFCGEDPPPEAATPLKLWSALVAKAHQHRMSE